jgi:hypothetical protein
MFSAHNVRIFFVLLILVDKNSSSNLMRVGSAVVLDSNQDVTSSRRHKKMSSQNLSMSSKEPTSYTKAGTSTFNNPARKTSLFGNMKRKQNKKEGGCGTREIDTHGSGIAENNRRGVKS